MRILLMLLALSLVSACTPTSVSLPGDKLSNYPNALIVDVRSQQEYAEGHIPSAINVSVDRIQQMSQIPAQWQGKPLIIYCRSGRRAQIAHQHLQSLGHKQLLLLDGDFIQWQQAGRDVAYE